MRSESQQLVTGWLGIRRLYPSGVTCLSNYNIGNNALLRKWNEEMFDYFTPLFKWFVTPFSWFDAQCIYQTQSGIERTTYRIRHFNNDYMYIFCIYMRSSGTDILYGGQLRLDVCIIYFISCDCIMNSSLSYTGWLGIRILHPSGVTCLSNYNTGNNALLRKWIDDIFDYFTPLFKWFVTPFSWFDAQCIYQSLSDKN
jgi:hypothetical protein